jgi:schlafen family protein
MTNHNRYRPATLTPCQLRLGEAHLAIVTAANAMQAASYVAFPPGAPHPIIKTDFGRDVGGDEIAWLVSRNLRILPTLKERTEIALNAAQHLSDEAREVRDRHRPSTYEQLIDDLARWAEQNCAQIETLTEYVKWLHDLDPLAPSALFTYRVWGSSRAGDRNIETAATASDKDRDELIRVAAEYALGLRHRQRPSLFWIEFDALAELAESMDPEDQTGPVSITYSRISGAVASTVLTRLVDYIGLLRDSLRNILIDVEKQWTLEELLDDNQFWCDFASAVIAKQPTEEQWWDLKESLPMWHTAGEEKKKAELSFAEKVAEFANAEGGAFVIGVTDGPRRAVGVTDIQNKAKHILNVVHAPTGIPSAAIRTKEALCSVAGVDVRFLIVPVARSSDSVAVHSERDRYSYPVRQGPGLIRLSPSAAAQAKLHIKSQDWSSCGTFLQC